MAVHISEPHAKDPGSCVAMATVVVPWLHDAWTIHWFVIGSMPEQAKVVNADGSHAVVVGAGWAGWGAAKALCEAGVRVTLIDAMADPKAQRPCAPPVANLVKLAPVASGGITPTSIC